jgi:lipoprotein-anchoring transpeptidase ErfK/SrfK
MNQPSSIKINLTFALLTLSLAGCMTRSVEQPAPIVRNAQYKYLYASDFAERYPLPATDLSEIDEKYLRTIVPYTTREQPGTIIIDTPNRYLYLVQENGMAIRYGIGVGAEGMKWSGRAYVGRKAEWPRWTPTTAMIKRDPVKNGPWASGMPAGLDNPLGPRALYLYQNGRDTLYRIHGTNEPHTIGTSVSSGCIRMLNQNIIDLYRRAPTTTVVVVLQDTNLRTEDSAV